jgi:hypothetical protein
MTTPQQDPRIEAAAARTRQAAPEWATAYGPRPWQSAWKRAPASKIDQEKKKELREQRKRLQAAGQATSPPGSPAGPGPAAAGTAAPPPGTMPVPRPGRGTPPRGDEANRIDIGRPGGAHRLHRRLAPGPMVLRGRLSGTGGHRAG